MWTTWCSEQHEEWMYTFSISLVPRPSGLGMRLWFWLTQDSVGGSSSCQPQLTTYPNPATTPLGYEKRYVTWAPCCPHTIKLSDQIEALWIPKAGEVQLQSSWIRKAGQSSKPKTLQRKRQVKGCSVNARCFSCEFSFSFCNSNEACVWVALSLCAFGPLQSGRVQKQC